jgi:hypothetical protein
MKIKKITKKIIGWREWVSFPELGIKQIKAKIDTGARTSALHAFNIEIFKATQGKNKVRFQINPIQRNKNYVLHCEADLLDKRNVKNSGGDIEDRYIIITNLHMGSKLWPIELTLTNRDAMGFRLLLGRTAINKNFLINPHRSFLINN